jgi:hypothetical protein
MFVTEIISYVYYTIFFQDKAEYNAAVATAGGIGFAHSPENAAATFGIPWPPPSGDLALIPRGFLNAGDFTILGFDPAPAYLTTDIDSIHVNGTAGRPASIWPVTANCTFIWQGTIQWMPAEVAGAPPTTPIPQRRFIGGFEHVGTTVEGGDTVVNIGRCASRVTGGQGYRFRGNSTVFNANKLVNNFRPGLNPKTSWERFYIRINQLGTNEFVVWRCFGNNPTNEGGYLAIDTGGFFKFYNGILGSGTLEATAGSSIADGRWHLIDLLMTWPTVAGDSGGIRLYVDHSLLTQYTVNTGIGMDRLTYHMSSTLGQQSTVDNYWEVDFDDWICADVPNNLGVESLNSIDWLYGSHVKTVNIVSGNMGTFTGGAYATLNQYFNPSLATGVSELTSSTALDTLSSILTDESDIPDPLGMPFGPIAAFIEGNIYNSLTQNGRIGYKIAGGSIVWTTIAFQAGYNWKCAAYLPSGVATPSSLVPFSLEFERPNSAATTKVAAMSAIIEYVGVWGQEDDPTFPYDITNNIWHHNCRMHNTAWAMFPYIGKQASPTYAIGGTFVGNGTLTILDVPAPPHSIWIRGVTVASNATQWFGASMGTHDGGDVEVSPVVSRVWADSTGYHISLSGVSGLVNTSGRTYQYIIFCDPGMRFNYCDAYDYADIRTSVDKALFDPNWIPEAGFVQPEILQAVGSSIELSYKGPGHAGVTGVDVSGNELTNFGSFASGVFAIGQDNLNDARTAQFNFSLWRMMDNQGDVMTQITSYVGDGNSSRIIPFPMITGRYPLFAIVIPNNAGDGYFRDPSHTGNNSQILTGSTTSTTAITGGTVDSIIVGSTLNTLGVTYEVFIILGDATGWNNGTFYPGFGESTGPWTNPSSSTDPVIVMDGGLNFNGDAPYLALEDASGIYILVENKKTDTLYPKSDNTTVEVPIPDPSWKTGYVGG